MFHCAVVSDLETNPLPPPHPELLKYFNPPKKMVKKAQEKIDKCIKVMGVKLGTILCSLPSSVLVAYVLSSAQSCQSCKKRRT